MNTLIDDVKVLIILKLKYFDILSLLSVDKNYQKYMTSDQFWQMLTLRDYDVEYYDMVHKEMYHKLFIFYDKWTIEIMCSFMNYKKRYLDINHVYEKINKVLTKYLIEYNLLNTDTLEQEKADDICKTFEVNTFYTIFDILSIDIEKNILIKDIYPAMLMFKTSGIDKLRHMSFIFERLLYDYNDIS
jgi:hypothetical protein